MMPLFVLDKVFMFPISICQGGTIVLSYLFILRLENCLLINFLVCEIDFSNKNLSVHWGLFVR